MDKHSATVEEAVAHLSRMVEDLSDVVARQDREIAQLCLRVERLTQAEAARQFDEGGTVPLADQRPPHW